MKEDITQICEMDCWLLKFIKLSIFQQTFSAKRPLVTIA